MSSEIAPNHKHTTEEIKLFSNSLSVPPRSRGAFSGMARKQKVKPASSPMPTAPLT